MSLTFDLLRAHSGDQPVCPTSDGTAWLTGQQLRQHVSSLRARLSSLSDARQAIAVAAEDRYRMLAACLSVWSLGHKVVLPPNHQPQTLARVARTSDASVLLTDIQVDSAAAEHVLVIDDAPAETRLDAPAMAQLSSLVVSATAPVLSVYTSGTTGEHQCCEKTAAQLFGEAQVLSETFGFSEDTTIAATVPGHHLYGLLFTLLVPLVSGGRFIRPRLFQPITIQEAIERHSVTDLVTVPAHLRALIGVGVPLTSLGRAVSSGAILEPSVAQAFRALCQCDVVDILGSTESGGIAWRHAGTQASYTPLPGVEVSASDDGRLLLRSPFLAAASDWEAMNDRVRLVEGGFEHLGRPDGVVKLGGKRVAVQEVEARALALDGVSDAAVLVQKASELRGSELWLAVASPELSWTPNTLKQALAQYFEPVALPRRYRIVEQLPRDALGKLKKSSLLSIFDATSEASKGSLELPTPTLEGTSETQMFRSKLQIPERWIFFKGHFPGAPIVPGVVQLSEIVLPSIAQAWSDLTVLEEVPVLKYKRPIAPGARLELVAHRQRGTSRVRFELNEAGEIASTGQLKFKVGAQHA